MGRTNLSGMVPPSGSSQICVQQKAPVICPVRVRAALILQGDLREFSMGPIIFLQLWGFDSRS